LETQVAHKFKDTCILDGSIKLLLCCQIPWTEERDVWWHEEMKDASTSCYPVWVGAEDPLFMLYTRYITNIEMSKAYSEHKIFTVQQTVYVLPKYWTMDCGLVALPRRMWPPL
jgi:hypothetical protein